MKVQSEKKKQRKKKRGRNGTTGDDDCVETALANMYLEDGESSRCCMSKMWTYVCR